MKHPTKQLTSQIWCYCLVLAASFMTSAVGQTPEPPRTLLLNQPIEREMKGDEAHSYTISLQDNQYLNVVVEQKGIDVVISLFDPVGKKLAEVDSPNGTQGPEPLSWITEAAGNYRLDIRSAKKTASVGRYEAKIVELRAPNEKDRDELNAERIFRDAAGLEAKRTGESYLGALNRYLEALPLYEKVGDQKREAVTLNNIGAMYNLLSDRQRSLEYLNRALHLQEQIDDKLGRATTLSEIAKTYNSMSERSKSLSYFKESLTSCRSVGNKLCEARSLHNIGAVYQSLGESQEAISYYEQSLPINRAIGNRETEASDLGNIGLIYYFRGDTTKAIEYYNQQLSINKAIGRIVGQESALINLGVAFGSLNEYKKALDYFNQALDLTKVDGNRVYESIILGNTADLYKQQGDWRTDLSYNYRSLPISRAVGYEQGEATNLYEISFALNKLGARRYAALFGKLSVNCFQSLRVKIQGLDKSVQQTYLNLIDLRYRHLAGILIDDERLVEAQQAISSYKDQQVFDLDARKRPGAINLTADESAFAARLNDLGDKAAAAAKLLSTARRSVLGRAPTETEASDMKQLASASESADEDYLSFITDSEKKFADSPDEAQKVATTSELSSMQTALKQMSETVRHKTAAVYTVLGVDNFQALIISADSIRAVSVPLKGADLNEQLRQYWGILQSDKYDTTKLGKELHDAIFKPLEFALPKGTKTIMWSLDGNLRYIPIGALYDGKHYLAERYNNVIFTRADSERMTRPVSPVWTGTGFGNSLAAEPDVLGEKIAFSALPGVTEELNAVFRNKNGGVIEGAVLPDKQFTKASFLDAMKQHRPLVHIASHFSFRPGDEARSFLLLGDGTAYTLDEMKKETDLFKGVELLTLSACNTAAQQPDANGREVDGFAELAQRLGAGAVLATLWSVSDASTPWLMRDFYATRQSKPGTTKADALRQAQLALLNGTAKTKPLPDNEKGAGPKVQIVITPDGKRDSTDRGAGIVYVAAKDAPLFKKDPKKPFAHPYYWAPFVLIGNWR